MVQVERGLIYAYHEDLDLNKEDSKPFGQGHEIYTSVGRCTVLKYNLNKTLKQII